MTEQEALKHLIACHALIASSDASGQGIYYQPTDEERPLLEGLMALCVHYSNQELQFHDLLRRAYLRPSEWGLLRGLVEQYTLRLPGVAERRLAQLRQHFAPKTDAADGGSQRKLHQ